MPEFDFEKFRLRPLVERLIDMQEVDVHDEPVALADLSRHIESTPRASLFRKAGPERHEMVAAVMGGRKRIAAAFGVEPDKVAHEYLRRLRQPQPVVEVPSGEAPVHEVVQTGEEIDLCKLPFHLQHELDGAPYISSGIDYAVDPATGKTNVGCRRLMFRNRNTMRANLTQPSDLKKIYLGCVKRGERLPTSFAIGSHPLDFMAAGFAMPVDEFALGATMRGEPRPMVRGLTNGVLAPADAEMIIEGYFDELGYREMEGPYGEFWGYYGPMHIDPVFHVTAITKRKNALFQSLLHGGRDLSRMDASNISCVHCEAAVWRSLQGANIEPAAVYAVRSAVSRQHVRVALRRGVPGQARLAIAAMLAVRSVKHAVVVDDDLDVLSNSEILWAMSSRFRPDKDLIVTGGYPAYYSDPTLDEGEMLTKVGYDLTAGYDKPDAIEFKRPRPPDIKPSPRYQTVRQALEAGPKYFVQLMETLGSTDGREIAMQLDGLREEGVLTRLENGEWAIKPDQQRA